MRRRLLVIVFALVAGLIVALSVPLVRATAERSVQTSFIGRVEDGAWFADMAATALESGRTGRLEAAADRYTALYDSRVAVVDADSEIVVASRPLDLKEPQVRSALLRALADRPAQQPSVVWPWDDRPFVLAEPVKRDGRVLGAVLIVSPTDRARSQVTDHLTLVGLGSLAALAAVVIAVATPVVRWVLRPVHELDRATHEVALGRLKTRVSERAGAPELRRLANSFNVMADSMHASQEQQRAFVAQASHQLRNPLTALRLRVENLEEFVNDPRGLHELHFAVEEADRFGEILDGLLRMARAEASEAERRPVDVSAVVVHRVDAWRTAYEAEGVRLTLTVPDGVRALSLPDCLDHALDTLLDNALKFGDGTPVDVSVTRPPGGDGAGAQRGQDDGVVEVTVRDGGSGLTAEELARAGGRFWRSTRHQNVRGTGLGLALTRMVVEAGGGELRLAAAEPHGLAATLRLPSAPPPPGAAP
ncbi:HAMP domain-containing histidine kinase [Streptomyces luteolifulvus]|uniref:histidine kinase n=1 Tax=Streptomyces luteolifulvus TaxID=2615112 RepID=A0A6H9UP71_9ACTN|nr:HAMP domain-containing sensor histidine kinase [Streptomyces luteolifulvus]KAB1139597.1 HAMP domain-containing histidine kinase [Streptomyces luteolifulvus]